MKSTGVIRKIDDLGRIVIPKEIRRNLRISDGDSLEIYILNEDIILKKYSMIDNICEVSNKLVDSFYKLFKKSIIITDKEKVVAASKNVKDSYLSSLLTSSIKDLISNRSEYLYDNNIIVNGKNEHYYLLPILSNYDVLGSIILMDNKINENDKNCIKLLCTILLKNVEE